MVFPIRITRTIARLSFLPLALLTFAAADRQASAQTAPQLVPYTARLIAGTGTAAIASGGTCPVSGNISTDPFGDGCLATEVQLGTSSTGGPRYAVADKNGNIFFGDFANGLVRRVDVQTGIITAVAGGATSSPAAGVTCGTGVSVDSAGNGCPANLVKLSKPASLVFDTAGNLYFSDNGTDNVRKIAATGGLITTTGIITNVAGNAPVTGTNTFGYNVSNTAASPVIAATQNYLNFPYGLAFDTNGNLYIADEGNNALEVINMGAATQTIQGLTVPAGTISKFSGYGSLAAKSATSGDCPDFVSTTSRGGCYFGKWTDGAKANATNNDGVYSVAVDPAGNVYFANEFNDDVGLITAGNVISNFAGIQGSVLKSIKNRGTAGSFAIGSVFGVALDTAAQPNLYVTDASSGAIWRVDGAGKVMYPIAGGVAAGSVCANHTDALGDGCPALQATFGSSGTTFASTALPGPGIYGISADAYGDVFVGDTETFTIREVASGAQFGNIGVNQAVTDMLEIHFVAGDGPASSGAYSITSGASIFTLGTATCTTNTPDNTTDCLLPVTATPTALGAFSGTLKVVSATGSGGTANFTLGGIAITSPFTRTTVAITSNSTSCSGATSVPTTTVFTLTATVASTGSPAGTVTFYANGNQIGTPVNVTNSTATLTTSFPTAGTYSITAVYSGDTYFKTSTTVTPGSITTASPTFTAASTGFQEPSVVAGGTALYSFALTQSVYTGTITFACQGLPAYASCVFSPPSITATGCSTSNTVAVSIYTQQATSVNPTSLAGRGRWMPLSLVFGCGLTMLLAFRRRRFASRLGGVGLMLAMLLAAMGTAGCGKGAQTLSTPVGTYTITITATGTAGSVATLPFTLKVN
ncbi:MAG TPA: Ig-like domain repeat protein [Acidobacteriaceae bacterium]